jgi:phosphate transport system substrate-binding protein
MALAAFAAGCDEDNRPRAEVDYGALSGIVRVDGSATVFPISEAVADDFNEVSSDVRLELARSGTVEGFDLFCRGEIDVTGASRRISEAEVQACVANGITDMLELQVAIDPLAVVVDPSSDFVDCLTVQQLHDAFKADGAQTWADLNPLWPAEPILRFYPGPDSGTFQYFHETIIERVDESAAHASDGVEGSDSLIEDGVGRYGLGYGGYASINLAHGQLRPLAIDSGAGCVEPTAENALSGDYAPLSRPLFIYTRGSLLLDRPEVRGFVKYYVDNADDLSTSVGYVPLPEELSEGTASKVEPFIPYRVY